jgi:hypothetical protein
MSRSEYGFFQDDSNTRVSLHLRHAWPKFPENFLEAALGYLFDLFQQQF